ncbi:MAG: site-specific DNA-methyltransferase [bacterium]|nr:site-specific DNA-methyltransferase [bacterium]
MKPYYQHGGITIYHGDCREILPTLEGAAAVLVTDPPYGIAFASGHVGHHEGETIKNDHSTELRDSALALWGKGPALVMGRWSAPRPMGTRMVLTWEKGEHVGMGDLSLPWKPNTEEVYVIGTGFQGRRMGSVIKAMAVAGCVGSSNTGKRYHVTEKPLELMTALLSKCPPGTVIDPFMGSGTTLVAAKNLGRGAIGIETEERYCEIAAKRLGQEVLFGVG